MCTVRNIKYISAQRRKERFSAVPGTESPSDGMFSCEQEQREVLEPFNCKGTFRWWSFVIDSKFSKTCSAPCIGDLDGPALGWDVNVELCLIVTFASLGCVTNKGK